LIGTEKFENCWKSSWILLVGRRANRKGVISGKTSVGDQKQLRMKILEVAKEL